MKNNVRTLKMLSKALELEKKGKRFYDEAVAKCQNQVGRDIFKMLRDDELLHMDRIRKIYDSLTGDRGWDEGWKDLESAHEDLEKVFRDMASKHGKDIKADTSDLEAIDVGLDFEQASVNFYEKHLEDATDAGEKNFMERMIQEERTHHSTLTDMKLYFTDPSSYFIETEKHGLDGA